MSKGQAERLNNVKGNVCPKVTNQDLKFGIVFKGLLGRPQGVKRCFNKLRVNEPKRSIRAIALVKKLTERVILCMS
jgi:hypothetical protein